jgi:IS605 OrfB family transposase
MIREDDRRDGGPQLSAIASHKRALAGKRRERGKPIRGEESCVELQAHVDNRGEDRFKKGARRIVNFAKQNDCDLIVIEKLAGLIPDAERERGINKALASWNRGNLAKWIKQLAGDAGMRVVEVHPSGTSQLCSHCGALGARFSADHGQPRFDIVGKMFACPECGYTANADHNASVNLHRRFFNDLAFVKSVRKGVCRVTKPDQTVVDVEIEQIKTRLAPRVFRICRGEPSPF